MENTANAAMTVFIGTRLLTEREGPFTVHKTNTRKLLDYCKHFYIVNLP